MNKNSSLVYRNPITPSQRHVRLLNRKDLIKITPLKDKTFYLRNKYWILNNITIFSLSDENYLVWVKGRRFRGWTIIGTLNKSENLVNINFNINKYSFKK